MSEAAQLVCPSCGTRMRPGMEVPGPAGIPEYGILSCDCGDWPVLAGIPILFRGRLPGSTASAGELCELLASGRPDDALAAALTPAAFGRAVRTRSRRWLPSFLAAPRERNASSGRVAEWRAGLEAAMADRGPGSTRRLLERYFSAGRRQPPPPLDYFRYRFGQPRHLVGMTVADLADPSRGPVLDLGCGGGHLTRFLVHRHGPHVVLGIDRNFFLLFVAATRIAPGARFMCADIERGLPLAGRRFGLVLMSNVLHFLADKRACIGSALRALAADGLFVASSVRNRLVPALTPSQALSPGAYQDLLGDVPSVVVSDDSLLRNYLAHRGPALAQSDPRHVLERSKLLTIVAGGDESVFRQHDAPPEWLHAIGRLAVNPLYRRTATAEGGMRLELEWPSPVYEEDNAAMKSYLPRQAELSPATVEALDNGRRTPEMRPLLSSLVLLDLPCAY